MAVAPASSTGHASRMMVSSSIHEHLVLEYPDAPQGRSYSPGRDRQLDRDGVFPDCGAPTCTTEVAFRVLRETSAPALLHFEADAILTRPGVGHDTSPASDAASLELIFP